MTALPPSPHHHHQHAPPTQPPTSQVAKQICSCLSAQYESHASSWLAHEKQTKVPSQPCHNVLLAAQTQSALSGLPACSDNTLLISFASHRPVNKNKRCRVQTGSSSAASLPFPLVCDKSGGIKVQMKSESFLLPDVLLVLTERVHVNWPVHSSPLALRKHPQSAAWPLFRYNII